MSEERPRSTLLKTALEALVVAAVAFMLLVIAGLVLASPQTRSSAFGKRMERRHPVRWAQLALVFGTEAQRSIATSRLGACGPEALPVIEMAFHDRSGGVRRAAVKSLATVGANRPEESLRSLARLVRDRRAEVRRLAYAAIWGMVVVREAPASPPLQEALVWGLQDRDPQCRREAAFVVAELARQGRPLQPAALRAFAAFLLTPSPPATRPAAGPTSLEEALGAMLRASREAHSRGPEGRLWTLMGLWETGTQEASKQIQLDLYRHPLVKADDE